MKKLLICAAIPLASYCIFAFVTLELNPLEWEASARLAFALFTSWAMPVPLIFMR